MGLLSNSGTGMGFAMWGATPKQKRDSTLYFGTVQKKQTKGLPVCGYILNEAAIATSNDKQYPDKTSDTKIKMKTLIKLFNDSKRTAFTLACSSSLQNSRITFSKQCLMHYEWVWIVCVGVLSSHRLFSLCLLSLSREWQAWATWLMK